jgi:hypothetical protein
VTKELVAAPNYDSEILSNAGAIATELRALIDNVPEAGGDAYASILGAILGAKTVEDLDAAWDTASIEKLIDVPIRVLGIHRMPSDFDQGLGMYLIVDAVVAGDGEHFTFSTGSVSVCAQLIRAHALDGFPLLVVPRRAKRPSANGYYPQHLEIVR